MLASTPMPASDAAAPATTTPWTTCTATLAQDFLLEGGAVLPRLEVCYTTGGRRSPTGDNVVWIFHALTGSSRACDWWPGLVGGGRLFDPERHYIVCANIVGSCYGSTSPASIDSTGGRPWGMEFPLVTMRDVARAHALLRAHLGIGRVALAIGGSMGGQQALEWACAEPDVFERLVLLATSARHSPWGIACNEAQRMALEADPTLRTHHPAAGEAGLQAARGIAMLTYRGYRTLQLTQDGPPGALEDLAAASYLRYQGRKFTARFNAHAYWSLTRTMDSHDVGRDRGGVDDALARVAARTLVLGIHNDVLFPREEQERIAAGIPGARLVMIDSLYGHDGFLVEAEAIARQVRAFLHSDADAATAPQEPPGPCDTAPVSAREPGPWPWK